MIFADISKSETSPSPTSATISILIPPPPLKSADVIYGRPLLQFLELVAGSYDNAVHESVNKVSIKNHEFFLQILIYKP